MSAKKFDYDLHFITEYGQAYYLKFYITQYATGHTLLAANCTEDGTWREPYSIISKDFPNDWNYDDYYQIFVDVNNIGDKLFTILIHKGFLRFTGIKIASGYCLYPLCYISKSWYNKLPKKGGLG